MLCAFGWSLKISRGVRKMNARIATTIKSYCHDARGNSQKITFFNTEVTILPV
jgi:hypothetical protein